jgi:hypothetical protein
MTCKLCHKNETDNTSGICWECVGGSSKTTLKQKIIKILESPAIGYENDMVAEDILRVIEKEFKEWIKNNEKQTS